MADAGNPGEVTRALRPIARATESLANVAYQRLSDALLTGEIPPGARLVMDQIAEQLGISRTPVRDALLRLERENLIEPTGRRGYVVRAVSMDEATHIYEVREAIEGFAARRVAEIGGPALSQVERAIEVADRKRGGPREVFEANRFVHRTIVAATSNPALIEMFDEVWLRARGQALFGNFLARDVAHQSISEAHAPLLVALATDGDSGFEAMRAHIRAGLKVHGER